MILAYVAQGNRLVRLPPEADLASALWIDLDHPDEAENAQVRALGIEDLPTLADMEEIEVSSRLYRENGSDYLTVVLPGMSETSAPVSGPVCFILSSTRLVTVRHFTPRPFATYPERAEKVGPGCGSARSVFLSLMDEIVGRLADILESVGAALDSGMATMFQEGEHANDEILQSGLRGVARQSDLLGRVRLSLLTLERAMGAFTLWSGEGKTDQSLRATTKALTRDLSALEVHADYLNSRLAMATDVTLGMVNLAQNRTVKIVSVVAVIFLPPTVIASAYGMNFRDMPELDWHFGYPMALGMMLASAVGTYMFFKWRKWL